MPTSPLSAGKLKSNRAALTGLDARSDRYATDFVTALIELARQHRATDIHLVPAADGLTVALRTDGVLTPLGTFPKGEQADVVTRFKVIADLLTYRTDVPQEGRVRRDQFPEEIRVSSFPTLYGEKIAVRLFSGQSTLEHISDLGLPNDVTDLLHRKLFETSGALLITGPAGSGKTTTAYACLREIARRTGGARNIATLEDPIEVAIPGIAQSQGKPQSEFDLAGGLRALLRQDPEVILVGEMRDPVTAGTALQAALTGQLVLTTFHAGSAAGAVNRLLDMGLEPYMLRSGVLAVLCQRLARKLCRCATQSNDPAAKLGLPIGRCWEPVGCAECNGTGYLGRTPIVEAFSFDSAAVGDAVLHRRDAAEIEAVAVQAGMQTRWNRAVAAIEAGLTSPIEVRRVLGFSDAFSAGK